MIRNTIAFTLLTLSLAAGIASGQETRGTTTTRDLRPFTHLARIPADSGKDTIRFEGAKVVRVTARIASTMDPAYCAALAFRDPGGSMSCPAIETGSPATAYEITYSYIGQPLASDEFGGRNFTFQVYFRPDELAPRVRQALMKKENRSDLAGYFEVSTVREQVRRIAIDEAKSRFCDGNYVDGTWTHSNAACQDEIHTTAIYGPSDYLTVGVEPVAALAGLVMTDAR